MMRRALAGTSVAFAAAALAMPLTPAGAAGVARTAADAWADFQTPAAWDNPKDNLHWYVESPVITSAQVRRTATVTVTTPSTLDCGSLAGGYGTAKGWTSVTLTTSSCTATSASVSYTVTKAMVGKRVSVLGWSSVATRATVDGRVTLGSSTTTATVTATRTDAVVPIATPTVLGSYQGKQVSIASAGGINEIWVGDVRYSAPEGTVAHVSLDGDVVNLWIRNEHQVSGPWPTNTSSMDQWRLNVATGAVTTQSLPYATFLGSGASGFVLSTSNDAGPTYYDRFYDWNGVEAGKEYTPWGSYPFITVNGFTKDAFVYTSIGHEGPTLVLLSNKGTVYGTDSVGNGYSVSDSLLEITSIDADGVSYDKKVGIPHELPDTTPNPLLHCRITAAGQSCVQA